MVKRICLSGGIISPGIFVRLTDEYGSKALEDARIAGEIPVTSASVAINNTPQISRISGGGQVVFTPGLLGLFLNCMR